MVQLIKLGQFFRPDRLKRSGLALVLSVFIMPVFPFGLSADAASWKAGAEMPAIVPTAEAVHINQKIYVLSGSVGHGMRQFFEVYDIAEDGWRSLTPLPSKIQDFASAAMNGRILVTGGRDIDSGEPLSSAWIYAVESAVWVQVSPMPRPVYGHRMVAIDNFVYVFAGAGQREIFAYNIDQGNWDIFADMPVALVGAAATADAKGNLIIAGGAGDDGQDRKTVLSLDIDTKQWTRLPDLPLPVRNASLVSLSDGLHIVGGFDGKAKKSLDLHFTLNNGKWEKSPKLPQARYRMASAVADDTLYIMGGAAGAGFFSWFTGSDRLYILNN